MVLAPATSGSPRRSSAPRPARRTVDVTVVGDVAPGDLVLVHAGAAISWSRLRGGGADSTDFLYPFIEAEEDDPEACWSTSPRRRAARPPSQPRLQQSSLDELERQIQACAAAMADRFARGGRLYTFGNGGSSTDAATLASLFARPAAGRPLPAWSLAADQAVVTALGNDVGFELIFSRQVIAHSKAGRHRDRAVDVGQLRRPDRPRWPRPASVACSPSGSPGTTAAGWRPAAGDLDYCFTIRSQSIHRIQESHARVGYRLWLLVQEHLATRRGPAPPQLQEGSMSGPIADDATCDRESQMLLEDRGRSASAGRG